MTPDKMVLLVHLEKDNAIGFEPAIVHYQLSLASIEPTGYYSVTPTLFYVLRGIV